ncbi:MAG: ABC transporter substrate-binding protein [Egibacteraceae bacterium]
MRGRAGMLLGALVLAACSGAGPQAPDDAGGQAADGAPTELRLAISGESEDGYDPTLGWGGYGNPLFQSTLLRRDENLDIVNDLATGYEVSGDGLVWTVTIRDDVTFSDGEPLTAEDVAYTFDKAGEQGGLTDVTVLDKAVAVDDTTVELRLKQPQSTFVNRLITLGIVPEHAHGDGYGRNPIGSGPYVMERWDEGQQLVVTRNEDYYGEKPAFERVVFLFLEEDGNLAAARAGEVQVAVVPQALAVEDVPGMRLVAVESVDNRGIMFPYPPDSGEKDEEGNPIGNNVTSDLAIRQAVNHAIDRKALVEGILEGYGSPASGPVDGLPWWEPNSAITDADPERAKQLLADGGWVDSDGDGVLEKNGVRAAFTVLYPASDSTRQGLALAVADMIRPLGIEIEPLGKSWDEIPLLMHSTPVLFGWGSHDQTEMYNLYHGSKRGQEFYNAGFFANRQVDTYLDLAMGATDPDEARAFWQAAQLDDQSRGFTAKGDAAWAWLVNLNHTYFVDECLDVGAPQVEPHGHGYPITAGITSWQWAC